jgi:hypothetical protein
MEKHRAAIAIVERVLGKPREGAFVETTDEPTAPSSFLR